MVSSATPRTRPVYGLVARRHVASWPSKYCSVPEKAGLGTSRRRRRRSPGAVRRGDGGCDGVTGGFLEVAPSGDHGGRAAHAGHDRARRAGWSGNRRPGGEGSCGGGRTRQDQGQGGPGGQQRVDQRGGLDEHEQSPVGRGGGRRSLKIAGSMGVPSVLRGVQAAGSRERGELDNVAKRARRRLLRPITLRRPWARVNGAHPAGTHPTAAGHAVRDGPAAGFGLDRSALTPSGEPVGAEFCS